MTRDNESSPGCVTSEAAPEVIEASGPTDDSVPEPYDITAWIAERADARQANHARRRAWLAQANAEHRQARDHGLRARHAQKLARQRRGGTP